MTWRYNTKLHEQKKRKMELRCFEKSWLLNDVDMLWYSMIFCLEPTVREQLDEKDFRYYYGIFFERTILKLLDHSYIQRTFATIRRHFGNGIWRDALQSKILRTWMSIGTNYFLNKFLETKIDKRARKINYIIIRACSSKNIAARHFTYYCMLLSLSNKPSF